jgi:hypothetical protein
MEERDSRRPLSPEKNPLGRFAGSAAPCNTYVRHASSVRGGPFPDECGTQPIARQRSGSTIGTNDSMSESAGECPNRRALKHMTDVSRGRVIEIAEYEVSESIGTRRATATREPATALDFYALAQRVLFAAIALILNLLLAGPLVVGLWTEDRAVASRKPEFDPGLETMRAWLVDDASSSVAQPIRRTVHRPSLLIRPESRRAELREPPMPIAVVATPTRNLDPVAAGPIMADQPNPTELERLERIYRAQIAARVRRALEQAGYADRSACTVRVEQAENGGVRVATVTRCLAGPSTQERLLAALYRAAPLPAPARADLFQPQLIIELGAEVTVRRLTP